MFRPPLMPLMSLLMLTLLQVSSARVLSADSDQPLHRADRVVGGTEVSQGKSGGTEVVR